MSCDDDDFWIARLEAKKARLVSLEAVLDQATYNSHSLDTGQTRQSITNHSIGQLKQMIEALEHDIAVLTARIYGCGVSQGRPGW